jgi:hypothetical protein
MIWRSSAVISAGKLWRHEAANKEKRIGGVLRCWVGHGGLSVTYSQRLVAENVPAGLLRTVLRFAKAGASIRLCQWAIVGRPSTQAGEILEIALVSYRMKSWSEYRNETIGIDT